MLKGSYRRSLKYVSLYGKQNQEEESTSCPEERAKHPSLLHRTGGALAPEVEAAGLVLPHSSSPVPPERQGTPSWPFLPLWLGSQSPLRPYSTGSGHFCTSVTGWAQRLQASRHQHGGCQDRSLAGRHTGIIPALLSQPSKLAPQSYQLLRRLGMVGKAVTFPPTQRTEASGPAAHDYGPLTATTPGTIALGGSV